MKIIFKNEFILNPPKTLFLQCNETHAFHVFRLYDQRLQRTDKIVFIMIHIFQLKNCEIYQ